MQCTWGFKVGIGSEVDTERRVGGLRKRPRPDAPDVRMRMAKPMSGRSMMHGESGEAAV